MLHPSSRRVAVLGKRGAAAAAGLPTTNLIEHLDATTILGLNDGDGVATWTATVGTNGTQGTEGNRPLYKTSIQNGLSVVRSDGTDDFLALTGLTQGSGSLTLIAALNPAVDNSNYDYLLYSQTGQRLVCHTTSIGGKLGWHDGAWKSIANAATGFQILSWVLTSGGNGEIFRNGASLGTAAYVAKAIGGTVTLFGQSAGANLPCDMGELLIYSTALDAATRVQAETYLNAKWAAY